MAGARRWGTDGPVQLRPGTVRVSLWLTLTGWLARQLWRLAVLLVSSPSALLVPLAGVGLVLLGRWLGTVAVGVATLGMRELWGITAPAISTLAYPAIYTIDKVSDTVSGATGKADSIDWIEKETYNNIKYQPMLRPLRWVFDD